VDVLLGQGTTVAEAVKTIAVTETRYIRWRAEYGGMKSDQVKRLKELELENARLRRAVSDLTLDKLILTEAARETSKPRPSPRVCREGAGHARCVRASSLPGSGPAPLHAAQAAPDAR